MLRYHPTLRIFLLNFSRVGIDFDGEEFRRIPYQVKIPRYPGKKKVTALPCFPLELDEDAENIRERLIKRGRKFRAYNIREEERMIFYHKGKAYKRSARASSRALDERISLFRRTFSVVVRAIQKRHLSSFC